MIRYYFLLTNISLHECVKVHRNVSDVTETKSNVIIVTNHRGTPNHCGPQS